jgi:hypothetical protein
MSTTSLPTTSASVSSTQDQISDVAARATPLSEYFYRVVVAAAGILIGAIVALFIGLSAGWIPINC